MGWPSKLITHNGETMNIRQWADRLGISRVTLAARLGRYGMKPEYALTSKPLVKEASGENYPAVSVGESKTEREHRIIAERALGRRLPPEAEVHHVDADKANNQPGNLVICPNHAYHRLLHMRAEAYAASGSYHWRKCCRCKQWGDPGSQEMTVTKTNIAYHKACNAKHQAAIRAARKETT
jgi:hypothetical protein